MNDEAKRVWLARIIAATADVNTARRRHAQAANTHDEAYRTLGMAASERDSALKSVEHAEAALIRAAGNEPEAF